MIKKILVPLVFIGIFCGSLYYGFIQLGEHLSLSLIRNDDETKRILTLLDDNFKDLYNLPDASKPWYSKWDSRRFHDFSLSEDILDFLNKNRNLWQYEYVNNPIIETTKEDYALNHFENSSYRIENYLAPYGSFYEKWTYYKETENHNLLIDIETHNFEAKTEPESEGFWNNAFITLLQLDPKTDEFRSDFIDGFFESDIATFIIKPATYPRTNLRSYATTSSDYDNAIRTLGIKQYYQEYFNQFERTETNFRDFWESGKPYFFNFISKKRYINCFKNSLENLLTTYDVIVQSSTYKTHFEAYDMDDTEFFAIPEAQHIKEQLYLSWEYGFWDRRYNEGTMAYVHDVLKEIQQHYR